MINYSGVEAPQNERITIKHPGQMHGKAKIDVSNYYEKA